MDLGRERVKHIVASCYGQIAPRFPAFNLLKFERLFPTK